MKLAQVEISWIFPYGELIFDKILLIHGQTSNAKWPKIKIAKKIKKEPDNKLFSGEFIFW